MIPGDALPWGAALGGGVLLALLLGGAMGWLLVVARLLRRGRAWAWQVGLLQARHWREHDLLVLGLWVSTVLLLFALSGVYLRQRGMDQQMMQAVAAAQNTLLQGLVAVLLWWHMRRAGATLRTSFGIVPGHRTGGRSVLQRASCWYLLSLPLVFLAAYVSQALFAWQGQDALLQPALELFTHPDASAWFRWWLVGMAVVGAPVIEEAFFRGVLLPVLLRKYAVLPALLVSALFFALVHGHTLAILPLLVLGLGLGAAYLQTGNLLVPICMHAVFNAMNLLLLLAHASPV